DSSTNTNFTTTQVSQIGSRVSSPVMNRRCSDARWGAGGAGGAGVMARIVAPAPCAGRGGGAGGPDAIRWWRGPPPDSGVRGRAPVRLAPDVDLLVHPGHDLAVGVD